MNATVTDIQTAIEAFFSAPDMLPAGGYSVRAVLHRGYWEVTYYTPAGVDFQSHRVATDIKDGRLVLTEARYRAPIGTIELPAK